MAATLVPQLAAEVAMVAMDSDASSVLSSSSDVETGDKELSFPGSLGGRKGLRKVYEDETPHGVHTLIAVLGTVVVTVALEVAIKVLFTVVWKGIQPSAQVCECPSNAASFSTDSYFYDDCLNPADAWYQTHNAVPPNTTLSASGWFFDFDYTRETYAEKIADETGQLGFVADNVPNVFECPVFRPFWWAPVPVVDVIVLVVTVGLLALGAYASVTRSVTLYEDRVVVTTNDTGKSRVVFLHKVRRVKRHDLAGCLPVRKGAIVLHCAEASKISGNDPAKASTITIEQRSKADDRLQVTVMPYRPAEFMEQLNALGLSISDGDEDEKDEKDEDEKDEKDEDERESKGQDERKDGDGGSAGSGAGIELVAVSPPGAVDDGGDLEAGKGSVTAGGDVGPGSGAGIGGTPDASGDIVAAAAAAVPALGGGEAAAAPRVLSPVTGVAPTSTTGTDGALHVVDVTPADLPSDSTADVSAATAVPTAPVSHAESLPPVPDKPEGGTWAIYESKVPCGSVLRMLFLVLVFTAIITILLRILFFVLAELFEPGRPKRDDEFVRQLTSFGYPDIAGLAFGVYAGMSKYAKELSAYAAVSDEMIVVRNANYDCDDDKRKNTQIYNAAQIKDIVYARVGAGDLDAVSPALTLRAHLAWRVTKDTKKERTTITVKRGPLKPPVAAAPSAATDSTGDDADKLLQKRIKRLALVAERKALMLKQPDEFMADVNKRHAATKSSEPLTIRRDVCGGCFNPVEWS